MAKRTKRKRTARAVRGETAPGASSLMRDVKDPLDTVESCRREVHRLHHEISMRHSWETAERIFKSIPTAKAFRLRLREEALWAAYELLQSHDGSGPTKAARHLAKVFPAEYGNSWQAIERHILRLRRKRQR
jgi:hypothetical protein